MTSSTSNPSSGSITGRLDALVAALADGSEVESTLARPAGRGAVFLGSGDSLSSALLAEHFGLRARSSGDVTWTGAVPPGCNEVVGISHSGSSAATVQALRIARQSGLRAIAITSNPDSPLAREADELQLVPALELAENVPVGGHLMLGLGVARVCGATTAGALATLATALKGWGDLVDSCLAELPEEAPAGISVLTLPELRGAGDFWMLKLIEATGVASRAAPLEESGHVDYFIGPQAHLTVQLVGADGAARHAQLGHALESTGQTVRAVAVPQLGGDSDQVLTELAGSVLGALVAEGAAARWGRSLFRGGAVNMDATHIKIKEAVMAS